MATNGGPIVAVGEVLWDLLPDGPRPGGAPFNFAFHCHQLGHEALIVSRVGDDELGRQLREAVRDGGMSDDLIQIDAQYPTGTVHVTVDPQGTPSFNIVRPVAWDFLEWDPSVLPRMQDCAAICFGTLAQRHGTSRETLRRFVAALPAEAMRVCDINLRPPDSSAETVAWSMANAHWLKLNESEVRELNVVHRPANVDLLIVTRGTDGCTVTNRVNQWHVPGVSMPVVDTVGAGDAFTAAFLTQTLEGKSPPEAARFANAYAALVVTRAGGTPRIEREAVEAIL